MLGGANKGRKCQPALTVIFAKINPYNKTKAILKAWDLYQEDSYPVMNIPASQGDQQPDKRGICPLLSGCWILESSGLSENALKLIESGRRDIKISELFQISKALDVRISAFLTPCDSQIYKRRKEEEIDCYVSLENLSHIFNISKSTLHKLCQNDEIPYHKISAKYFFKASEINNWLKHHIGSKKKMKKVLR
jgi:transcriptional regulator with XRE-family HTH domain